MKLSYTIPVLGALALVAALPDSAQAKSRSSFDISIGLGYSNYNRYGYSNYNSFRYSNYNHGYHRGHHHDHYYGRSTYYAPRYYAPRTVYRETYYRPAPRVIYRDYYYDRPVYHRYYRSDYYCD